MQVTYNKFLEQVTESCRLKLYVVTTNYMNKEQVFYSLAVKVMEEVTVELVTGKSDKLQPIATSYSKLHGASNVIRK